MDSSVSIKIRSGSDADDIAKARILVLGDSGVGKSSLVHYLCEQDTLKSPQWTVGCDMSVMTHEHKRSNKTFFLEMMDVGGHRRHAGSRHVFYSQINGIILVFDVANRNSYQNLRKWIKELVRVNSIKQIEEGKDYDVSMSKTTESERVKNLLWHPEDSDILPDLVNDQPILSSHQSSHKALESLASLPVFIVGNKADLQRPGKERVYNCMKDFGLEGVYMSALKPGSQGPPSALPQFFDSVIERRFFDDRNSPKAAGGASTTVHSRRFFSPSQRIGASNTSRQRTPSVSTIGKMSSALATWPFSPSQK